MLQQSACSCVNGNPAIRGLACVPGINLLGTLQQIHCLKSTEVVFHDKVVLLVFFILKRDCCIISVSNGKGSKPLANLTTRPARIASAR
jgi:hypothetical protein